ncbi:hypothetical protein A33M_0196 [Rhodovulum sp. PH10]|uniref:hypothetical protein n=1 Tax=Rhodovulum sp. PH10 TaxID=1187851 RepID=UPI00027C2237|nr:hypothetical protein [Rhodovulum sp. PH10]EJW10324.1 hypothetical protein A33M_0196 [Rhodovulum sp. PH10]
MSNELARMSGIEGGGSEDHTGLGRFLQLHRNFPSRAVPQKIAVDRSSRAV